MRCKVLDFRDFPQDRAHKLTPPLTSRTSGCQPEGELLASVDRRLTERCLVLEQTILARHYIEKYVTSDLRRETS